MKYIFSLIIILCLSAAGSLSIMAADQFHCERDTVMANQIISELASYKDPFGKKLVYAASRLEGAELDDYYRTDSVADLRINLESFTPLMFVNSVIALTKASEKGGVPTWRNLNSELIEISCRRGENNGFPSIMFHTSDWITDNVFRGNVRELTEDYSGGVVVRTKSLDEMTRHRNDYKVLADSATFEKVRMTEMGFRTHRVPTLKKETIEKKEITDDLRDGDIIILVPGGDGLDMYDIGFVAMREDGPHFIHVSPRTKKVVEEPETLQRYLKLMTKYFQGYRLLRVKN